MIMEWTQIWTQIWPQIILALAAGGIGAGLINAFSKWRASKAEIEANEPHDYAKSYQILQQTVEGLSKSLAEERRYRRQDRKRLDEMSIKLKSVQEDAATYSRALQNVEKQNLKLSREYKELKREHENLQAQYRALKKSVNNN